jgi:hypothetical protein
LRPFPVQLIDGRRATDPTSNPAISATRMPNRPNLITISSRTPTTVPSAQAGMSRS